MSNTIDTLPQLGDQAVTSRNPTDATPFTHPVTQKGAWQRWLRNWAIEHKIWAVGHKLRPKEGSAVLF